MIGYLEGQISHQQGKTAIILTNGVGYEVNLSGNASVVCQKQQGVVQLFIHTHVREDQLTLFGFATIQEKNLFLLLISVSGVGPKTALELLSVPANHIIEAIASGNSGFIQQCPGIGKKTADRVIMELQEKVAAIAPEGAAVTPNLSGATSFTRTSALEENYSDIMTALLQLGYDKKTILVVLSRYAEEHSGDIEEEEAILKYCLQHL